MARGSAPSVRGQKLASIPGHCHSQTGRWFEARREEQRELLEAVGDCGLLRATALSSTVGDGPYRQARTPAICGASISSPAPAASGPEVRSSGSSSSRKDPCARSIAASGSRAHQCDPDGADPGGGLAGPVLEGEQRQSGTALQGRDGGRSDRGEFVSSGTFGR
jgi:hypothetical protein